MTVADERAPLERLLKPRSICLIGAGDWTDAVAAGARKIGFAGKLWRVHPTRASSAHVTYHRSVGELPGAPDAAFVAVPKSEAPVVARALNQQGAGGFVCFTAGFSETGSEAGHRLTNDLVRAAGDLPFFGPNCYGFANFFDAAALWPDQVVGERVERGVALICQSGTIALTLMFNERSLPIGYLLTVGNQTRLSIETLIASLSEDPRVSAFGLYVEGIKDMPAFARAAALAIAAGKPIALVKTGRTDAAARTAQSHTGALSGTDTLFDALCRDCGIARCDTLSTLCETLKVFHAGGALRGRRVLMMGASGGDMAMAADASRDLDLDFAPLDTESSGALQAALTERVTIANPLDIHTYLWFDPPALQRAFAIALRAPYDAVAFVLDNPPERKADVSAFDAVINVFIAAAHGAPARAVFMSSLPETMSESTRARCLANGVVPLQGLREALEALSLAALPSSVHPDFRTRLLAPPAAETISAHTPVTLSEDEAKSRLAGYGLATARRIVVPASEAVASAEALGWPVVMKAVGPELMHKSELGGVVLDVRNRDDAERAAHRLSKLSDALLIEEMITDGVAEVLIGIRADEQFGQALVIGTGGVFTELWRDSVTLLPPWTDERIRPALDRLKLAALLRGFRGKPAGDMDALLAAIHAVCAFAQAHASTLLELDVNPLIVRANGRGAVAVDALVRISKES